LKRRQEEEGGGGEIRVVNEAFVVMVIGESN